MKPYRKRKPTELCHVALLTALVGCAGPSESRQQSRPIERTPNPAIVPNERPGPESVALRTALLPPERPQPIRIQLHERRTTTMPDTGTVIHELDLDLRGILTRTGTTANGEIEATLAFKHIRLAYGLADEPGKQLVYDSARQGNNNPLADVMQHVADAEVSLRIGPSGRLRHASGLDPRWRRADLLMVPPALLTAQWLFRDAAMAELLAEALFPPMPAGPVTVGDAWETDLPANIPLAARLTSRVRGKLVNVTSDDDTNAAVATIESTGNIAVPPPILEGRPPALKPIIQSSRHTITQTVNPEAHTLTQTSQRDMDILLTLQPPTGNNAPQSTIKQTRKLRSTRGPQPAKTP